jgi:magnesium chelatase family protein
VRARAEAARERQRRRYAGTPVHHNAELTGDAILTACEPTDAAQRLLQDTLQAAGLSGRAWSRILKVARTVADLEAAERVESDHVLEAASFRVSLEEGGP